MQLTEEQRSTIDALKAEVAALKGEADELYDQMWEALCNDDEDFNYEAVYDKVMALDGEANMKAMIAAVPKAGDVKVQTIRRRLARLRNHDDFDNYKEDARIYRSRLDALEGVNEWRESLGLPLLDRMPKGLNGDGSECAIAQALKWKFNDFRTINSLTVGGSSADVEWLERIPKSEYDALPADEKAYLWVWDHVEDEAGNRFVVIRKEVTKTFSGQGAFVSAFDNYEFIDLIDDSELSNAVYTAVERGDDDRLQALWQEYRRRFGDDAQQVIVTDMKNWGSEAKFEFFGDRVVIQVPVVNYDDEF